MTSDVRGRLCFRAQGQSRQTARRASDYTRAGRLVLLRVQASCLVSRYVETYLRKDHMDVPGWMLPYRSVAGHVGNRGTRDIIPRYLDHMSSWRFSICPSRFTSRTCDICPHYPYRKVIVHEPTLLDILAERIDRSGSGTAGGTSCGTRPRAGARGAIDIRSGSRDRRSFGSPGIRFKRRSGASIDTSDARPFPSLPFLSPSWISEAFVNDTACHHTDRTSLHTHPPSTHSARSSLHSIPARHVVFRRAAIRRRAGRQYEAYAGQVSAVGRRQAWQAAGRGKVYSVRLRRNTRLFRRGD